LEWPYVPPGWQPSRRDRTDLGSSFSRTLTGAVFVVAGLLHFLVPSAYQKIMPPYLPLHRELIYLSGAMEVAGGMGLYARFSPLGNIAQEHAPRATSTEISSLPRRALLLGKQV
jgi:uncharacterized protein YjeT (DUF2065 family)